MPIGRIGVVGMGHADQRSALRGEPHALWRGLAHFGGRSARALRRNWSSRRPAGCAPGSADRIAIERSAEMRYGEQIFEIDVALDGLDWDAASLVDQIEDRFHRRHEELYTYASRDQEVVFVNARVAAVGEVSQRGRGARARAIARHACSPRTTRQAFFGAMARGARSMRSTRSGPATPSQAPRSSRPRPRRSSSATKRPGDRQCAWLAGYCAGVSEVRGATSVGLCPALRSSRQLARRPRRRSATGAFRASGLKNSKGARPHPAARRPPAAWPLYCRSTARARSASCANTSIRPRAAKISCAENRSSNASIE